MKSRRFVLVTGLSFLTVLGAGCARRPDQSAVPDAAVEGSPQTGSSQGSSPNEAIASPSTSTQVAQGSEGSVLSSGSFVAGEHPTQGTVRITNQSGKRVLELDQTFETSTSGPDLVVILHRSPDVIGSTTPPAFPINEGDYVLLAPLKSYSGAQSYDIPDSVNLEEYQSAAIWCRQFNATFGAATLSPA
jgi:hypothetical protein